MKKKYYFCIVFCKCMFTLHTADYVAKVCKSAAKIQIIIYICKSMADFYVNYGSLGAKLLGQYSCNKVNLKLHKVNNMFVVSKNRKILKETFDPAKALCVFHNAIYLDQPGNDLFMN